MRRATIPAMMRVPACLWVALGLAQPGRAREACLFYAAPGIPEQPAEACLFRLERHRPLPESVRLHPRRGTLVVRLTPQAPFGGYPSQVDVYPGPPHLTFRISADRPKTEEGRTPAEPRRLRCTAQAVLRYAPDGNALETVKAQLDLTAGRDLHAVWTWSGVQHRLYLNGELAAERIAASPFPPEIKPPIRLLSNTPAEMLGQAPVHEIAGYPFAMTPDDVRADLAAKDDAPFSPAAPPPPVLVAQWAPGEKKAYVALDRGGVPEFQAAACDLTLRRDGQPCLRSGFPLELDGFGETVVTLPEMPPGAYRADARLLNSKGEVSGSVASEPWHLPPTPWLGNTLGLTDAIQPPWTPIRRERLTLHVWGREVRLAGGFGLPVQIVSQGRDLLAEPVGLEIVRDGSLLAIERPRVKVTRCKPHVAEWEGSASAGDVRIRTAGRLEYDGMILLRLHLEPLAAGAPAASDAIRLKTVMPGDRALFLNTSTDQGYWWYPYRGRIPDAPGVVHDNLKQRAGKSRFLFYALCCDHHTGLEWFADNLAGWHVDESRPIQEIIREPNGDVRLQCHLVNRPLVLNESRSLTFGYEATPVKPLPADWRSAYVHYHTLEGLESDLALWWLWTDDRFTPFRPNIFLLRPDDLQGFATARGKTFSTKLAPFVNQHVTLPAWPENQAPDKGWGWFHNLLQAESANDGWTALPTRGIRDYWAWNLDAWLKSGGLEAIYIDEANTRTIDAGLLTGSGYVTEDGTHGYGHNTLGMRQQLKRVRQLFIDHGQRPIVWIPVYAKMIPHAFAFVDVVSEGEAFMFDKPDGPDWIDTWGANLTGREPGGAGQWLLSLGPAHKFGFIPVFLNYIKFYNDPRYVPALRAQYGLLALLDIIPIAPELGWFFKARQEFGMDAPGTTFHPFFEQQEIRPARDDVKASYYRRSDGALAVITNLGNEPFDGPATLDLSALGLDAGTAGAADIVPLSSNRFDTAYREVPLAWDGSGGVLRLAVPAHDFRMLRIGPRR